MVKVKAVFYSIYDHVYMKAETVARWTQEVKRKQPELARVSESVLENPGAKNPRETFD